MLTLCPCQLAWAQCDFKFWALEGEALQRMGPGPSASGFLALHNFGISAKYICHFPPSGEWNVQTPEAELGSENGYITKQGPSRLSVPVSQTVVTRPSARAASTPQRRGPHPLCFEFQTNWEVRTSALHQVSPHYSTATLGWGPPGQPSLLSSHSIPPSSCAWCRTQRTRAFPEKPVYKADSLPRCSVVLPSKEPALYPAFPVSPSPMKRPTTDAQSGGEKAQGSQGRPKHNLFLLSSGSNPV